MARWTARIKIKHLIEHDDESHAATQRIMSAIADVLEASPAFNYFDRRWLAKMRDIPQGDDLFGPADYANNLLDRMYDFAAALSGRRFFNYRPNGTTWEDWTLPARTFDETFDQLGVTVVAYEEVSFDVRQKMTEDYDTIPGEWHVV